MVETGRDATRVIAVDGYNLALQRGTGVATYGRNLIDGIHGLGWDTWMLYGAPVSARSSELLREIHFADYLGGAQPRRSPYRRVLSLAREQFVGPMGYDAVKVALSGKVELRRFDGRLPRGAQIFNIADLFAVARRYFQWHRRFLEIRFPDPPDIMHWTYPLPIRAAGVPNVYTVHDIVPLRLPYTTLDNKKYYYRLIKGCLDTADRICTVSERSKEDILQMFGAREEHVTNTYQAVGTHLDVTLKSFAEAEAEVEGIYGLKPGSYFLFYGAIEPKKNVGRLIEAFLSTHLEASLVIVGSRAWKSDEEMKLIDGMLKRRPGLAGRVHIFDYAPRPFLISLVRLAKAVVFPSLYEGFGLPVLEAMQLGTPTLTSGTGSLPEVAGGATVQVDPYDTDAIARGLRALDQDAALRAHLAEAGKQRAQAFGADGYRARLRDMYSGLLR